MSQTFTNYEKIEDILSMAHEMIEESIYHIETMAHVLQNHQNKKAAEVFFNALKQFHTELEIVENHIQSKQVPNIPPWKNPYPDYMHPSLILLDVHYLMSESEAVKIITNMIGIHKDFYIFLQDKSREKNVIDLVDQLVKSLKG